ncbi:hypothetical protein NP493_1068g00015 [Ridgeia piscesae]|uniref:VWFA domain-containing protein n=1 Tax=Ridgeia piscesae TaxID=27915 RepID=A0AAD9NIB7_RIDPI|nr:hypothetical protein NP493_1068g00015 [Ridgeia piscesae]
MDSLLFALVLLGISGSYVTNAEISREQLKKGCSNKPADIVFVLDESGSIWGPYFKKQLEFVKDVVGIFQIGPTKTRIGTVTFDSTSRNIFNLNTYSTATQIKQALDGVEQHRGGTRTYDAIDKMHNEMLSSSLARPGVPRIAIVITDGESEDPVMTEKAAKVARDDGIIMFAVGVGNKANRKELVSIASSPVNDYMFMVDNYAGLKTLRKILAWRACQALRVEVLTPLSEDDLPLEGVMWRK